MGQEICDLENAADPSREKNNPKPGHDSAMDIERNLRQWRTFSSPDSAFAWLALDTEWNIRQ